jgi:hypothetical protein
MDNKLMQCPLCGNNDWSSCDCFVPDYVVKIIELQQEVERLRGILSAEINAANNLLASISKWGYGTAGQSLPTQLSDAVLTFEMERLLVK